MTISRSIGRRVVGGEVKKGDERGSDRRQIFRGCCRATKLHPQKTGRVNTLLTGSEASQGNR